MGFLTPQARGDHAVLTTFALQQLAQLRTTVVGLTDEQAHSTPSASVLNLTGLLRHCAQVAVQWSSGAAAAPDVAQVPAEFADDEFLDASIANEDSLADTLAYFDRYVAFAAEQLAAATDLDAQVPVPPAPWFPEDLGSWDARWVIAHIIEEVTRHLGHADIIRESIDGKGAFELNELADAQA